jgi:hypothetical protein
MGARAPAGYHCRRQVCTAPIVYVGQEELKADIENLKNALRNVAAEEAFMARDITFQSRAIL